MRKIKRLQKFAGMILMLFFTAGALTACGKAFDAKGFVEAKLDQMFQGDMTKALTFTEKETKADLERNTRQRLFHLLIAILSVECRSAKECGTILSKYADRFSL